MKKSILMIEDDEKIRAVVKANIEEFGFAFDYAEDGEQGLQKALEQEYSLILLDVMLPKLGGMEVCRRLREEKKTTPIIMITAKTDEIDRVMGLDFGADDYLTKPFSIAELGARIRAVLRRAGAEKEEEEAPEQISIGDVEIDLVYRKVEVRGQPVELTVKEFELLVFLAAKPGRPFTREQLLQSVWGYESAVYESNVNQQINRLRQKIEVDPADPTYILTVWGVGYRFAGPEDLELRNSQEK